jgi:sarcosine oxidase/L-pipecolate oxidase
MEKALEAIHVWRTDPLYKPFYHQSGLINIDNSGLGRRMIDNYKALGADVVPEMIPPQDFKKLYGGFYQHTDFRDVDEIFINKASGWAEASKALKALIDAAIALGVRYVEANIQTLTFDQAGGCTGVQTADGEILAADHILLCTGAGTAKLLADSAPQRPELQVDGRMVAAAVVTGIVKLDASKGKRFTAIPATVHAVKPTQGKSLDHSLNTTFLCANVKRRYDHASPSAEIGQRTLHRQVLSGREFQEYLLASSIGPIVLDATGRARPSPDNSLCRSESPT